MMYYNNILCFEVAWLTKQKILSTANYKQLKSRGQIETVRRGCKGTKALVAFDSIPDRFKEAIIEKVGDPYLKVKESKFQDRIELDHMAPSFFSKYKLPDGRNLPPDTQLQYCNDAHILNTIDTIIKNRSGRKKALGSKATKLWDKVADAVNSIDKNKMDHTLPTNPRRIQNKYNEYKKDGHIALISKKWCNDNSRKVTVQIEKLILSLYTLPNKPYSNSVHELYMQFLGGAIEVVDTKTGELFDREDFMVDGMPVTISEATVWNYINDPKNRVLVDSYRSGALEFNSTHRPHHHRDQPNYSLSKISMDDRDLPRKMINGKRVKAYYAYDVASGACIGASYSKKKDTDLFLDCMRDMFRFLHRNDIGIPMEMEVENHLVKHFEHTLMQAGNVFPFVRWANPGNAQEKYAESMHRVKKYGYEKKYQDGIGRFYSKLEANRVKQEKIFDAENDNFKEKYYEYKELVADDLAVIQQFNNAKHPNQKKYKGMSRMEVLMFHLNPKLAKYDESLLAKYIGVGIETSIRRSQYLFANNHKYTLPSVKILERLKTNNLNVMAYYIPASSGIETIHLYQDDVFICSCKGLENYQTAKAEQTEKDEIAYLNQAKYVSEFDKTIKAGRNYIGKPAIIENTAALDLPENVEIVKTVPVDDDDFDYSEVDSQNSIKENAFNSL